LCFDIIVVIQHTTVLNSHYTGQTVLASTSS